MATIQINIYRSGGEWFGARTIDGAHDGCDELDVDGNATEREARDSALAMPLNVTGERTVTRVADVLDVESERSMIKITTRRDLDLWAQEHVAAAGGTLDDARHVVDTIQADNHPAWGTDWAEYLDGVDVIALAAERA